MAGPAGRGAAGVAIDAAKRQFHAEEVDDVLEAVDSSHGGLTTDEAAQQLQHHGPNELPEGSGRHPVVR